jgi:hypothetical protein
MKLSLSTISFAALFLAEQASGFVQVPAINNRHFATSASSLKTKAAAVAQLASSTHGSKCIAVQTAGARLSTALSAAPQDAQSDDDEAAPDRSNYRFIGFAKVWLAFVLYAFLLAPGHNPAAEAVDKVTNSFTLSNSNDSNFHLSSHPHTPRVLKLH